MPERSAENQSMRSRIENLLSDFLYKQGYLNLPGLGSVRFERTGDVEHDEVAGSYRFSPDSLSFDYAPKTELDEELVMHISRETGKMKSLAASDLQSYLQFGQELINISKPFHIKGLGVLQKTSSQNVELVPEEDPRSNLDRGRRTAAESRQHTSDLDAPFSQEEKVGSRLPRNLAWGIGLLLMLSGGYALLKYLRGSGDAAAGGVTVVKVEKPDIPGTDTFAKTAASATGGKSEGVFRVVIENSERGRAFSRYADLKEWGHDIRMSTKDSVRFKLYIPIDAPLSDTVLHRDSLRIFFGRPVSIETGKDE